ncbi:MAG: hypothetical protein ABJL72_18625 [Roseobacter sp.]
MGNTNARLIALMIGCCVASVGALAQETDLTGKLAIELNSTTTSALTCTLTFKITNGYPVDIDQLIYETVLFDATGTVNRLTLFDFGALPVGRPRVRQFAVPDVTCDALGQVLLNGLHTCTSGGQNTDVCATGLIATTRTAIEVLG